MGNPIDVVIETEKKVMDYYVMDLELLLW